MKPLPWWCRFHLALMIVLGRRTYGFFIAPQVNGDAYGAAVYSGLRVRWIYRITGLQRYLGERGEWFPFWKLK
jgi:hypothetical protein